MEATKQDAHGVGGVIQLVLHALWRGRTDTGVVERGACEAHGDDSHLGVVLGPRPGAGHGPHIGVRGHNLGEGGGELAVRDLGQPEVPLGVVDFEKHGGAKLALAGEGAQGLDVWEAGGHEFIEGSQLRHRLAGDEDLAGGSGLRTQLDADLVRELDVTVNEGLQSWACCSLEGHGEALVPAAGKGKDFLWPRSLHELAAKLQGKRHSHRDVLELGGNLATCERVKELPAVLRHDVPNHTLGVIQHDPAGLGVCRPDLLEVADSGGHHVLADRRGVGGEGVGGVLEMGHRD
mmetsp:Transcript_27319/g.77079  ORF Transcript_27319/g.77079 Transcript_27319/m.77079 type:complete len:291 (+) Transcript_27319:1988-2860(+)